MKTHDENGALTEEFKKFFAEKSQELGVGIIGGSMFDKDESAKVILHAVKKGKPSNDQQV